LFFNIGALLTALLVNVRVIKKKKERNIKTEKKRNTKDLRGDVKKHTNKYNL